MVLNLLSSIFLKHYHQASEIEMKEMIQRHFDRLMTRDGFFLLFHAFKIFMFFLFLLWAELVSKFDNVDKKFDSVDKRIDSLETIILGQNQPKSKPKKSVPPPPPPVDSSQEIQIAVSILGCFSTTRMGPGKYCFFKKDLNLFLLLQFVLFQEEIREPTL